MADALAARPAAAWSDRAEVRTLRRMASVDRYNRWIYDTFSRHVGRRVLEVGSGIGNLTPFFLGADRLTCVDVQPDVLAEVRRRFIAWPQVRTLLADVGDPDTVDRVGAGSYDTVACINVLEHVKPDAAALRHMRDALAADGKLLLLVPAGPYLYGRLDRALGHYRRYAKAALWRLVEEQGFEVVDGFYLNAAGIPGWFASSRVLRRDAPPRALLWLFNLLTPAFVWFERRVQVPFGLSIVIVARRADDRGTHLERA